MTFNVMKNVDTCFDNVYLALLANTLLHVLTEVDASHWREDMLDLIRSTLKITYAASKGFRLFEESLFNNARLAVVTEHPDI
jgi:hypothetical protein